VIRRLGVERRLRGWGGETRTRKCRILWWQVLIEAAA
jgi:hypothetical protein